MKEKPIQVVPDHETFARVERTAKRLQLSRARFALLSLETMTAMIESGEARIVNGRIEFSESNGHPRKPLAA